MPRAWLDDTLDMHYELDDYTDPWTTPDTIYASTVLIQGPGQQGLCWRLAKSSWRHARFLTATANVDGWLSDFAGGRRGLMDEVDTADLVVMVATPGGHAQAAIVGEAYSLRRVMRLPSSWAPNQRRTRRCRKRSRRCGHGP